MTLSKNDDVLVIGAGAMGAGIAQVAAAAGHRVRLYDLRDGVAAAAIAQTSQSLAKLVERGKMTETARAALIANLNPVSELNDLSSVALVVEAVKEDLEVKQALFAEVEGKVAATAILATNTSSISVTAIASVLRRPERFAGLHFFNPAPVMALVEVIEGLGTDPAVTSTLVATAAAWGKSPVIAKNTPGFIVNRVARSFYAEAMRVLQEGAAGPATLDAVMRESAGFRMGPFELMDMIGHDVNFAVTSSVFQAYFGDPRFTPSLIQQELVAAGRLGRKSGRGFYDYAPGLDAPAPEQLPTASAPATCVIQGDLGPAEPLAALFEAAGIAVRREAGDGLIRIDGATLALSDGGYATARAAELMIGDLVVFDLALDWTKASRIAIARADQAPPAALAAAAGLFQALGKTVSPLDDVPGLIAARTITMIISEAIDAVHQGVATPEAIDTAMLKGVNYPRGPIAWADALDPAWVVAFLDKLARVYGEDRYRGSALLRRLAARGGRFLATGEAT